MIHPEIRERQSRLFGSLCATAQAFANVGRVNEAMDAIDEAKSVLLNAHVGIDEEMQQRHDDYVVICRAARAARDEQEALERAEAAGAAPIGAPAE